MKQANVKVGRPYMLSLGRKGAVRAVVAGRLCHELGGEYMLETYDGKVVFASARRLSPNPVLDRDGKRIGSEA